MGGEMHTYTHMQTHAVRTHPHEHNFYCCLINSRSEYCGMGSFFLFYFNQNRIILFRFVCFILIFIIAHHRFNSNPFVYGQKCMRLLRGGAKNVPKMSICDVSFRIVCILFSRYLMVCCVGQRRYPMRSMCQNNIQPITNHILFTNVSIWK